jgi:hypothetical protein
LLLLLWLLVVGCCSLGVGWHKFPSPFLSFVAYSKHFLNVFIASFKSLLMNRFIKNPASPLLEDDLAKILLYIPLVTVSNSASFFFFGLVF